MREAHTEAEVEAANTGARKTLTCILKNENQTDTDPHAPAQRQAPVDGARQLGAQTADYIGLPDPLRSCRAAPADGADATADAGKTRLALDAGRQSSGLDWPSL
jgi:hypothetical protein